MVDGDESVTISFGTGGEMLLVGPTSDALNRMIAKIRESPPSVYVSDVSIGFDGRESRCVVRYLPSILSDLERHG